MDTTTPRTDEAWENAEGPAVNIADVMRAKCKELERELAEQAELLRDSDNLLDEARSCYIAGTTSDLEWDKWRDAFRQALRNFLEGKK